MTSPATNAVQIVPSAKTPAGSTAAPVSGAAFAGLLSALTQMVSAPAPAALAAPVATANATTQVAATTPAPAAPVPGVAAALAANPTVTAGAVLPQSVPGDANPKPKAATAPVPGPPGRPARRTTAAGPQAEPAAVAPAAAPLQPVPSLPAAVPAAPANPAPAAATAGPAPAGSQPAPLEPALAAPSPSAPPLVSVIPPITGTGLFAPEKLPASGAEAPPASQAAIPSAATLTAAASPAQATTVSASAVPTAPDAAPASLARQLAPAIVQLAHGPSGNAVTLQLDPAGLGHVQVRIDSDATGNASVQVTAERPETLRLLVADQPHLHQVLDHAGVSADGRSLSFALATPDGGMFGGTDTGGGGSRPGSGRNPRTTTQAGAPDDEPGFTAQSAWLRAGVDITA